MGFSNLPLALSFRVEIVAALRFGKALATIRSRHMRKVKKRARQFLSRADTCQNQLDERKPINSHWLKHANLMPVLNYLASKAEGLDWCQTRHLLSLLAWYVWKFNSRCENIHIWHALLKTAQTWPKLGEKIRPLWIKGHRVFKLYVRLFVNLFHSMKLLSGTATLELHTNDPKHHCSS